MFKNHLVPTVHNLLMISYQADKAALTNPTETFRYE